MQKRIQEIWTTIPGDGPVVAVALHDGHRLRPEVQDWVALGDDARLREEDPYTASWTTVGDVRIVGTHSRFQVDLNRPRDRAVYQTPADAWGLQVWRGDLPEAMVERSLAEYDAFYRNIYWLLRAIESAHGGFVIYDLHTYNHRRDGQDKEPADPEKTPQVNIGTGTLDRDYWAPLLDRFMADLCHVDFQGGGLDVRENVKFQGGGFAQFVHHHFPETGCVLSVEVKKFFMDEWSGDVDVETCAALREALVATVPGVRESLHRLRSQSNRMGA